MASVAKRAPKSVFAAIFLTFCLIGWVALAALAQDGKQEPTPPSLPTATSAEPPAIPQDVPVAPSEATKPAPLAEAGELPSQTPAQRLGLPEPPVLGSTTAKAEPPAPSKEPALDANSLVGSAADDPEKSAMAFVEQNQKMAESQLTNLKAEEAKLRDRLRKVEAGIKRWESLLGALKQSQGSVAIVGPGNPGNWKQAVPDEPGPQRLVPDFVDPIPKAEPKPIGIKK
jgi:hypothetical protein